MVTLEWNWVCLRLIGRLAFISGQAKQNKPMEWNYGRAGLLFSFGGLRAQSAIGSAEKRRQQQTSLALQLPLILILFKSFLFNLWISSHSSPFISFQRQWNKLRDELKGNEVLPTPAAAENTKEFHFQFHSFLVFPAG